MQTDMIIELLFVNIPNFSFAVGMLFICNKYREKDAEKYMNIIKRQQKLVEELIDKNTS